MVSGLQRRSSTFGKKPLGSKQDPRPISDKGYQQSCARLLIQYLSTHSYEHPVSLKTLASPMSKDVFNIMQARQPVLLSWRKHLPAFPAACPAVLVRQPALHVLRAHVSWHCRSLETSQGNRHMCCTSQSPQDSKQHMLRFHHNVEICST